MNFLNEEMNKWMKGRVKNETEDSRIAYLKDIKLGSEKIRLSLNRSYDYNIANGLRESQRRYVRPIRKSR